MIKYLNIPHCLKIGLIAVLTSSSTAIHGGRAAVNKLSCGFRLSFVFTYLREFTKYKLPICRDKYLIVLCILFKNG